MFINQYNNTGDKMKLNRFQKFLLAVIISITTFSVLLNISRMVGTLPFSSEGYNLFNMVRYTLVDRPAGAVLDTSEIISQTWSLEEENEMLRKQVEGIASLQAKVNEQAKQIEELQAMNDLKVILSDYEMFPTTVLSRSYESWDNHLTIDLGIDDGIMENYAVISSEGLIGRVEYAGATSSTVKLLSVADGSNKVSVKVIISDNVQADAILERYNHEEQAYVVKLLDSNNTVVEGMSVITSGMGGVFPSGLLVGEIIRVEELENAIGMDIFVKPAADFGDLSYLYVVKRTE